MKREELDALLRQFTAELRQRIRDLPLSRAERRRLLREAGLLVGFDDKGGQQRIRFDALWAHMLVVGASGRGKSQYALWLLASLIRAGINVVVIDGKGDLIRRVAEICFALKKMPEQVAIIDPHRQSDYVVGLNPLELSPGMSPEAKGKALLETLKKLLKEDGTKVWLEEWMPGLLALLSAAGLSLAELFPIARLGDAALFRYVVMAATEGRMGSSFVHDQWKDLSQYPPSEQAVITRVLRTRGSLLWTSPAILPILGQRVSTIDFHRFLATEGNVILANLGISDALSDESGSLLGLALLESLADAAWARHHRPDRPKPRVVVFIDEASRFVSRRLAQMLDVFRGLHVSLCLCCQTIEQLRNEDPFVAASVLGNTNVKVVFSTARADAEELARELYSGHIDLSEVKDEIRQTKFWPRETTRTVKSESSSRGESCSTGSVSSDVSGLVQGSGTIMHDGLPQTFSTSSGMSSGQGSASSRARSESLAFSESEAEVPFYEYEPFEEVSSRTFVSVPEAWERVIGELKKQGVQRCVIGVGDEPPIAVTTPTIRMPRLNEVRFERYLDAIDRRWGRLKVDVLDEISTRVDVYVREHIHLLRRQARSSAPAPAEKASEPFDFDDEDFLEPVELEPPTTEEES